MLVLSRRLGESIIVGDKLFISLVDIHSKAIDLAIYDSFVRIHSEIRIEEGQTKEVAPHIKVTNCGIGRPGSAGLGIDTSLSICRKELWNILPGGGKK